MTTVCEEIPGALADEVDAALAWFNRHQDVAFEVTGIIDPETEPQRGDGRELKLILCGGDRCEQRSFRVAAEGDGFNVFALDDVSADATGTAPLPELDPPPGARRRWLDRVLGQHHFVVLVFYRGYW